ncbi:MAG: hypothetical protein JOY58_05015 [Solirubrobacterales bacterium]|nr:hypothetical protein [Solirubrobacterales bacterium]MBV9047603.1 hypothetical protein [Solirubrobacterales bacterium]
MSSVVRSPNTPSAHRAQIVAEAVVSAYIHEIAPTGRERGPVRSRGGCSAPRAIARPAPAVRVRTRPLVARRRAALELGA